MAIGSYIESNKRLLAATFFHVKHRKREPEGVHGQLEGCNRNLHRCGKGVAWGSRRLLGGSIRVKDTYIKAYSFKSAPEASR